MTPERLLERLDEIGQALASTGQGLALIGLGSVGEERERLDEYSDLDFFAIVRAGTKQALLDDPAWLAQPCPVAYLFQNTEDGYKLLYEDGIFCEMAIFEQAELESIPFAPGRVIWKAGEIDEAIRLPVRPLPARRAPSEAWLLGEALTCLYVGLQRYRRGETLSAQRFIQHYAVERVLELWEQTQDAAQGGRDPFVIERRLEQRHPDARRAATPLYPGLRAQPRLRPRHPGLPGKSLAHQRGDARADRWRCATPPQRRERPRCGGRQ